MSNILFRQLENNEFQDGYKIICETTEYLLSKNIRQWTRPLPLDIYRIRQNNSQNFGLFVEGNLSVVLSLFESEDISWQEFLNQNKVYWLSTLATCRQYKGQALGKMAVNKAIDYLKRLEIKELYLDCVYNQGFLPKYYQELGFNIIARKEKEYSTGIFDMVLMKRDII